MIRTGVGHSRRVRRSRRRPTATAIAASPAAPNITIRRARFTPGRCSSLTATRVVVTARSPTGTACSSMGTSELRGVRRCVPGLARRVDRQAGAAGRGSVVAGSARLARRAAVPGRAPDEPEAGTGTGDTRGPGAREDTPVLLAAREVGAFAAAATADALPGSGVARGSAGAAASAAGGTAAGASTAGSRAGSAVAGALAAGASWAAGTDGGADAGGGGGSGAGAGEGAGWAGVGAGSAGAGACGGGAGGGGGGGAGAGAVESGAGAGAAAAGARGGSSISGST